MGKKVVDCKQLEKTIQEDKSLQKYRKDFEAHIEDEGFSPLVIRAWARTNLRIYIDNIGFISKPGSKKKFDQMIKAYPKITKLIFLQNNHSIAITQIPESKKWCIVDSLSSTPQQIGSKKGERSWRDIWGQFSANVGKREYDRRVKIAKNTHKVIELSDSDEDT